MQHIRVQRTKSRSVNRLNIRMRNRVPAPGVLEIKNRINLRSIRELEQITPSFDYNHLETLSLGLEPQSWAPQDLDYQSLDGAQQSEKAILGWCLNVLSLSEMAQAMIDEARKDGWNFGLTDLNSHDFHLDVVEKKLLIHNHNLEPSAIARSSYFINAVMVSLMRGLRDIWQEKRHGGFEEHYGLEHILMLERVRAADLDVVSIMIAWELRNREHPEIWRHILASDSGDMAMAYSNVLEQRVFTENRGNAATTAFRKWYDSTARINLCDHETLDYLDDLSMQANGEPYHGTRRPTEIGVEILSCLPDKTAYLKGWGEEIMHDPHFCGLHDPINQAHFIQIANERAVIYKDGVGFRDAALAAKIFPVS